MYGNLLLALKEKGVSQKEVAKKLDLSPQSVYMKIHGRREFTAPEMFTIQREYFPNVTLEELFAKR